MNGMIAEATASDDGRAASPDRPSNAGSPSTDKGSGRGAPAGRKTRAAPANGPSHGPYQACPGKEVQVPYKVN